jgi:prolyl oligopeptidase
MGVRPFQIAVAMASLLLAACASPLRLVRDQYPFALRDGVVDVYHGTAVPDPYRWLEELDGAQTRDFVQYQNMLSMPFLEALPQRAWIRQRLTQLYAYERFGVPMQAGGQYFYLRNSGQQDQAALRVAPTPTDPGRLLIDPGSIRGDATVSLADFVPSPDGKLLAYALSDAGSDWKTWRVRDVATGADQYDLLRNTKFTSVSWARDGSGFWYSAYPDGNDQLQPVVRFHRLGTNQDQDPEVFRVTDHPTRTPYGIVTQDGRYLVLTIDDGTLSNGISVLSLDGSGKVDPLFAAYDGLYGYIGSQAGASGGTELFFTTTAGAPRGRVVAVDLGLTGAARLRVVVPESALVLQQAALAGNRIVSAYLEDARSVVELVDAREGQPLGRVALPGLGAVGGLSAEPDDTELFFSYADFSTPTRILRLDLGAGQATPLREPAIAADLTPYVTEQVFYTSKDGTRVPMFLVHRRDVKRNGRNPVMLYGYGGFDISMTPAFSPATLVWLEMGGVYAVANLRGGGEYGAEWHAAGTRERKQNVFDDFIAAAEYLVAEGWTKPSRIVSRGGSNGGLLVAATLLQRPDLFGAALPDVGVLDMLRYHTASANARQWSDDYGLSENEADFRAQLAYSPLHNTDRHRCYPPTLITTASQDNRVVPWHSFKFAAALQHAQQCPQPVLIRVETRAGHGAGKPTWMQIEHFSDQWAFAAAALGMRVPKMR